jgi:hypothetical protein
LVRGLIVKFCAVLALLGSSVSNGDTGGASPVSTLSTQGPHALTIVTVGLFGALLADSDDEPTQDLAAKEVDEQAESQDEMRTSESSPTITGISAGS